MEQLSLGVDPQSEGSSSENFFICKSTAKVAHIWTGSDTACRQYSTGGIKRAGQVVKDRGQRKICHMCSSVTYEKVYSPPPDIETDTEWTAHLKKYPDAPPSEGETKAMMASYANGEICRETLMWIQGLIDINEDTRTMSNSERRKHFAIIAAEHRMGDPFVIKRKFSRKRII